MAQKTKIEWCDSTVNPTPCCTGCELFPEHCYAAAMHRRYDGHNPGWPISFIDPSYFKGRIEAAAKWSDLRGKRRPTKPWLDGMPRLIFVDDLGDPFAPFDDARWQPDTHWLHDEMRFIEHSPHIWLILTKWPKRFAAFAKIHGPLPRNLWGGVSVTTQETAWRIGELLKIDLALRLVSLGPLLGPVKLPFTDLAKHGVLRSGKEVRGIGWIIAEGESGSGARPTHPDWLRLERDQCVATGVPFFFKQWGEWAPLEISECSESYHIGWVKPSPAAKYQHSNGYAKSPRTLNMEGFAYMHRPRKRQAGRLLDGREWDEMPAWKNQEN